MAITFKTLLVAAILERVDRDKDDPDRAIPVAAADIIGNSPVSQQYVGGTATAAELSRVTIIYSDNSAANLLLPAIVGPKRTAARPVIIACVMNGGKAPPDTLAKAHADLARAVAATLLV